MNNLTGIFQYSLTLQRTVDVQKKLQINTILTSKI